jgi:hypothetical protein
MTKAYDRYITCPSHFFTSRCLERGYSIEETKDCVVKRDGMNWTIDTQHAKYPHVAKKPDWDKSKLHRAGGVGTELKKILKMVGITAAPGCSCNRHSATMDKRGIEWCEENVETIVLWLQEEATKRKLPFAKFVGRKLVKLAISRAKKSNKDNE